ncbi:MULTISPECIES: DUF2069 domain-containing protein [Chromobacterium]|uniref:DUF2069 domain-containing protein n=1 Tax=Chromobacterium haemolyticum TaxID=394935 RepID=A0A1W0D981_9NEIS|nr:MULTISPECIES: DUF2069 domain-containing protein [Chromobacterium]OQS43580.1 hypothetical protein B0T45_02395 [Chromobacterium haemolyticum]QOZ82452.1 DUF2069 domain-containing protein [Chromobacterium sp. Rain0013]WON82502.1 DUF2069 domain-containing protein [Chromobacterium haemolyticum]
MNRNAWHYGASASLIALILLCLAWELWLAPLRPGGSLLALKAAVLLLPLRGILGRRLYTYQWASMFILAYFTEGVMRGWADRGLSQQLAWGEIFLSGLFFVCVLGFARTFKLSRQPQ